MGYLIEERDSSHHVFYCSVGIPKLPQPLPSRLQHPEFWPRVAASTVAASHGQNVCGMASRKAVEELDKAIGVPQQVDATLEEFLKLFMSTQ